MLIKIRLGFIKNSIIIRLGFIKTLYLFVYPFSFDEFLVAEGKSNWVKAKKEATPEKPLLTALHNDLVQHFRTFLMVGGMPASIEAPVRCRYYQAGEPHSGQRIAARGGGQ